MFFELLVVLTGLIIHTVADPLVSIRTPHVAGGVAAALGEFPHYVGIGDRNGVQVWCGGGLIHQNWVVTAAHCWDIEFTDPTKYTAERTRVYLGKVAWKNATLGQNINIKRVIIHPQYQEGLFRNDIALVELSANVTEDFTNNIRFMELEDSELPIGKVVWAMGWGLQPNGIQPNSLLKVDIKIVEGSNCLVHGEFIQEMMMCIGQGDGKDTCAGDSGGPVVYKLNPTDQRWIAAGIVSFGGSGCGLQGVRGTYTKISTYRPWVRQYVNISAITYRETEAPSSSGNQIPKNTWLWLVLAFVLFAHTAVAATLMRRC